MLNYFKSYSSPKVVHTNITKDLLWTNFLHLCNFMYALLCWTKFSSKEYQEALNILDQVDSEMALPGKDSSKIPLEKPHPDMPSQNVSSWSWPWLSVLAKIWLVIYLSFCKFIADVVVILTHFYSLLFGHLLVAILPSSQFS